LSGGETPPAAAPAKVVRLKRRREFLAAARGPKAGGKAFLLQAVARRGAAAAGEVGVGITVTRKIGGAVVRNRAKRRLREALRRVAPGRGRPGHDYVAVARPPALTQPFAELVGELERTFAALGRRLDGGR
jgi:ribonuclease P protein component